MPGPALALAVGVIFGIGTAIALLLADPRAVVMAIVALGLAIAAVRWPSVGVIIYLLLSLIHPEELGLSSVVFRLQLIFAVLCVVALALPALARRRADRWEWSGTDKVLVALLLAGCASVPWSVSRLEATLACWNFSKLLFAYFLVRRVGQDWAGLRAVTWTILIAAALPAVLALRSYATGMVEVGERGIIRAMAPTSAASDANTLANTLIASLPLIVLVATVTRSRAGRLFLWGVAALCLYVVSLTGARAGVISLIVVILLLMAHTRKLWLLLALPAILIGLWVVLPSPLRARYLSLGSYQGEVTFKSRVDSTLVGMRILRDHPLTGCGLGCFMVARWEEQDRVWLQPHNLYAQVASETGLIGCVAFAAFLYVFASTCVRARRRLSMLPPGEPGRAWRSELCSALLIMLVAMLVQGLAGHNFSNWHYYLGAALATNVAQSASRPPTSPA